MSQFFRWALGIVFMVSMGAAWSAAPVDYLGVPGPIRFEHKTYQLAWSSPQTKTHVRHEYFPKDEAPDAYRHMVMIDRQSGTGDVWSLVRPLANRLGTLKKKDPFVNFDVVQNKDKNEVILDFIVRSSTGGKEVVEWNAYRYASISDSGGNPAVLLFGISRRAYDDDRRAFMLTLKDQRMNWIKALGEVALPKSVR